MFRGLFMSWKKWSGCWTPVPSGPSLARVGGMPCTLPDPVRTAVRDLVGEQAAGLGPGLVGMYSQEVRPRCAGAWPAGERGASLFPLGLVARPFSGRSDQMCWEGAPYSHRCTPGVCPACPGGLGPRWLGLPGRKSRKSCLV